MFWYHKLIKEKSEVVMMSSGGVEHVVSFDRYIWVVVKQLHHLKNKKMNEKVMRMIGDLFACDFRSVAFVCNCGWSRRLA